MAELLGLLVTPVVKLRSIFSLYMHRPEAMRLRCARGVQGSQCQKSEGRPP
jgi:hypothetical protein